MPKPRTRGAKPAEKISVSMPDELWEWIDSKAGTHWGARSQFLQELVAAAKKTDDQSKSERRKQS